MDSLTHASATSRPASRPRAKRRRLTLSARAGASLLAVIVLAAVAPVLFTRANPEQVDIVSRLAPPSRGHPLGTDNIGRDLLARLGFGSPASPPVGPPPRGGARPSRRGRW